MPTYQYACTDCGHELEAVQSFSDAPLTQCPACEGRLRKRFNSVGIVFKGSGFYRTDSRNGGKSAGNGSADKSTPDKSTADKSAAANGSGGDKPAKSEGASGSKAPTTAASGGSSSGGTANAAA